MVETIVEPVVQEEVHEASQSPELSIELEPIPEPVIQKKKGRPAGSKDQAPRKKPIKIIVEPLKPAEPEVPHPVTPRAKPEPKLEPIKIPKRQPQQEHERELQELDPEPLSPRAERLRHAEGYMRWRGVERDVSRAKTSHTYTSKLQMFPVM